MLLYLGEQLLNVALKNHFPIILVALIIDKKISEVIYWLISDLLVFCKFNHFPNQINALKLRRRLMLTSSQSSMY